MNIPLPPALQTNMLNRPQTLQALQSNRVSLGAPIHFGADSLEKSAAPRSLLALAPTQQTFINKVKDILQPFGVEDVQRWDETKTPPLPVLQAFIKSGAFVAGVPLPSIEQASGLLNSPALQPFISEENRQKLTALATDPAYQQNLAFLKSLGAEGASKAMAAACMEITKKTGVGVGTFMGVNNGLAAQSISKIGTQDQQALWLNALNQGIFTYAFGLTEENIGSDPRSIETTFKKEIDANGKTVYRLNGNKKFIGNAARVLDKEGKVIHRGADFICVYAVDNPKAPPSQRTYRAFMVPRTLIGEENIWHSGKEHNKMGLREVNNGNFKLKDVVVPEELMLGIPEEDIYKKLLGLLDITRLFVGAMSLGSAEASLEIARQYAAERDQNGGKIQQFQGVTFPLDMLESKTAAIKLMVMEGARLVDEAEAQREKINAEIGKGFKAEIQQRFNQEISEEMACRLVDLAPSSKEIAEKSPKAKGETFLGALSTRLNRTFSAADGEALVKSAAKLQEKRKGELRVGLETAMAKLFASELAEEAAHQGITTLGGNGFMEDTKEGRGLPKRMRDARVVTIYEGTSNVNRNVISGSVCIGAAKKVGQSLRSGIRYFLFKSPLTKRLHFKILKDTSRTPQERVNAGYQYAVTGVLEQYQTALATLEKDWKKNGTPAEFAGWDQKDIDRQQNLIATLPVQKRMHLMADIATYRKLLQLATSHMDFLAKKPTLTPDEQQFKKSLKLFEIMAEEAVVSKGREMGSKTLAALEAAYIEKMKR